MFTLEFLSEIRRWEAERIVSHFRPGARILDIGAGTGQQALEFTQRGFDVEAVDVSDSLYAEALVFPVKQYDGVTLPFPEASFDIVFSSSVLEHVPDLTRLHSEIRRVLRDDGYVVHVLPTQTWRIWTSIAEFNAVWSDWQALKLGPRFPITHSEYWRLRYAWRVAFRRIGRALFRQRRHGAHGNVWTEIRDFNPDHWRRNFKANGFRVEQDAALGLFYTGRFAFGPRMSVATRVRLARILGSACQLYVLRKN
jgi:ubiquinone/menaquinone biosynthesis C-methylase UbiE